ncbi:MAG: hypothetical protein K2K03_01140, partial [Prevotella sp.]|nr:hypothetical protein [Prevotella sp.]
AKEAKIGPVGIICRERTVPTLGKNGSYCRKEPFFLVEGAVLSEGRNGSFTPIVRRKPQQGQNQSAQQVFDVICKDFLILF